VPSIVFQSEEEFDFSVSKESHIKDWIKRIAQKEGKICGDLFYFFCGDEHLLNINKEFLSHDYYTDIITFDYSEKKTISGEIFISIDRVRENSGKFKQSFEKELLRIMIHGVLHLCGYGDKKAADKKKMRMKEDEALELFSNWDKLSHKRS
jgi:probable rRNA maturation factor